MFQTKTGAGLPVFSCEKVIPVFVNRKRCHLVVVEPRSHKVLVVHGKPEGLNKVQFASGIGAQPDDVAGIGRNLRMH